MPIIFCMLYVICISVYTGELVYWYACGNICAWVCGMFCI